MTGMQPYSDPDRWAFLIEQWAQAKQRITGSDVTRDAYLQVLTAFRAALHAEGLELNSDVRAIALFAPQWASRMVRVGKKQLAANSYNRRLSIVSSFYAYAIKHDLLADNPMTRIERAKVDPYADAMPIDAEVLKRQLYAIPTTSLLGKRDLALLLVAVMTGRRVSELRDLNVGDIAPFGDTFMLTWQHVKGGKRLRDSLEPFVARILTEYLQGHYGLNWRSMPTETPVWVSLSTHGYGERLSIWGIAGVYKRRLGISKVHTSRYTFASLMEQLGASLPEIQRHLGHANSKTTDRYLKKAASVENKHSKDMGKLLGYGEERS